MNFLGPTIQTNKKSKQLESSSQILIYYIDTKLTGIYWVVQIFLRNKARNTIHIELTIYMVSNWEIFEFVAGVDMIFATAVEWSTNLNISVLQLN